VSFDIDCPVSSIQTFATNFGQNKSLNQTQTRFGCLLTNGLVLVTLAKESGTAYTIKLKQSFSDMILLRALHHLKWEVLSCVQYFPSPISPKRFLLKTGLLQSHLVKHKHIFPRFLTYNFLMANLHSFDPTEDAVE
jgi:hypothetical protein